MEDLLRQADLAFGRLLRQCEGRPPRLRSIEREFWFLHQRDMIAVRFDGHGIILDPGRLLESGPDSPDFRTVQRDLFDLWTRLAAPHQAAMLREMQREMQRLVMMPEFAPGLHVDTAAMLRMQFVENAAHAARQIEADARAWRLLEEWLSPDQRREFLRNGMFTVRGGTSGRAYVIDGASRTFNVTPHDDRGRTLPRICFGPAGNVPTGDFLLAQKIALETREDEALAVANVENPTPFAMYEVNPPRRGLVDSMRAALGLPPRPSP